MTGLTPFLCNMLKADRTALLRADVGKLAAKYGVRPDHAAWYIGQWVSRV